MIETKPTNGDVFIDTNILIYLYSADEPIKKQAVEVLFDKHRVIISTQVVNEFVNVMTKKKNLHSGLLDNVIDELTKNCHISNIDIKTIKKAVTISQIHKYAYFDSLIIASALENACSILFTEDLHNNHVVEDSLQIKNPFFVS